VTGDDHVGLARYYNLQFAAGAACVWALVAALPDLSMSSSTAPGRLQRPARRTPQIPQ
jgi:hypothetical protein